MATAKHVFPGSNLDSKMSQKIVKQTQCGPASEHWPLLQLHY